MTSRQPYEPSVQSIFGAVLPSDARVEGDPVTLRARGLWPRLLRATGLGEIQGGEIVLVPPTRVDLFLRSARDLARAGIAGAFVPSTISGGAVQSVIDAGIAIAVVDQATDMKALQVEIERYIIRRRRELFDVGQYFHRLLVDAAIAGASIQEIIDRATDALGRTVVLDRDGEIVGPGEAVESELPREALLRIRLEIAKSETERIFVDWAGNLAASAVLTGDDRRGTVIVTGARAATLDEDEMVLSTLAAACAIVLSRESLPVYPPLDDLLSVVEQNHSTDVGHGSRQWTALAVSTPEVESARTARALAAELAARNATFRVAHEREVSIALIAGSAPPHLEDVAASIAARLGLPDARAGLSRTHSQPGAPVRAAREALAALNHAGEYGLTRFENIELSEILAAVPDWEYFVAARLGPLLDGTASAEVLLQTLSVYLVTGHNAVEAARRLHVHRNTLRYRLRSIQRQLGVELDRPENAFVLDLALRLLAAHGGKINRGAGSD